MGILLKSNRNLNKSEVVYDYYIVITRDLHLNLSKIELTEYNVPLDNLIYKVICKSSQEKKQLKLLYKSYNKSKCKPPKILEGILELPRDIVNRVYIDKPKQSTPIKNNLKKDTLQLFYNKLDEECSGNRSKIIRNKHNIIELEFTHEGIAEGKHEIILDFSSKLYSYYYNNDLIVSTSNVLNIFK